MTNALSKEEVSTLGNILVTNSDFLSRLQQILVRDQHSLVPLSLSTETDPVDCAVDLIRCNFIFTIACIGRKHIKSLFVSGIRLEREAAKGLKGFFKK